MTQHADIKLLTQLGLTTFQAQVYLALTKLGTATAKTIASIDNLDRANVYRAMSDLQKLNLVEKMLTKPINFKAIPIKEGAQMLLENKHKEQQVIEAKTQQLIDKYKTFSLEKPDIEDCHFSLIPENKAILRKIREMNERCQECCDFIFYGRAFLDIIDEEKIYFKKFFKKGITIRLLVYLNDGENLYKEFSSLPKNEHLIIRYTSKPSTALIVCDKKEALINTTTSLHIKETSLWSNNHAIVSIFQDYFNQRWQNSNQQGSPSFIDKIIKTEN